MINNIQSPPDGGMLYTETNFNHLFPEPLNTVTSVFFLCIAIYWTIKLWGKWKQYTFLSFAVILLYIGGIGGTIYHGLRQWHFFIMMDWLPIMLLCLTAGIYFITRISRWYYGALLVLLYFVFYLFSVSYVKGGGNMQLFININYAIMGAVVLLPVLVYLSKTHFAYGRWVGFALTAFIIALFFRIADGWGWISTGTHFLWHTFGAVAAFSMFKYLFLINCLKIKL
ncbi:hypothetical protein [Flavobacterium psychrotrophum]|uniref:hypothetical protein n=1 Tax=Flavobacterium psychrotrophum TaxID=2294119 RepID=UPI000E31D603|nr:hypothetical protein [Flavobacterium psychrotrophum]